MPAASPAARTKREMPLAEAVAIGYAESIFIAVPSVPLPSERVGIQRASAAMVGFIGVLMIAQPGAGLILMRHERLSRFRQDKP